MKIKREFEAEDVHLDGPNADPVHQFLMMGLLLAMLQGAKPQEGDPEGDKMLPMRRLVATFLTMAEASGISITKAEMPAVYTS